MSWDVDIVIDTGNGNARIGDYNLNMTYNVSPMYYAALDTAGGFLGLDEMMCSEAEKKLRSAVRVMMAEPEVYKAMNPKNGWGDYESAVKFLIEVADACTEHPKCKLRIT